METAREELKIAIAHHQASRLDEAEAVYRQVLASDPLDARAWHFLGVIAHQRGEHNVAAAHIEHALAIFPDDAEALNNLSTAYQALDRFDDAVCCGLRSLELRPNSAATHYNLGNAYRRQDNDSAAIDSYHRAIALNPEFADAHYNLGSTLFLEGNFSEAAACLRRAVELRPTHALARFDLAGLALLSGDFEHGWPEYEWRWQAADSSPPVLPRPRWKGEPLFGKTILLQEEQGCGDTFQFIRYASLVKELGATVIFECSTSLMPLLARCPGIDRLIGKGDELPDFDFHIPLLSLPGVFQTRLETIPVAVPYLFADPALVAIWRNKLSAVSGLRVGINWQGRSGQGNFRRRDFPLGCIEPLTRLPGVRLISLHKGDGKQDLDQCSDKSAIVDAGNEIDTVHGAFMDTAAIMMNLDLVITSDTSIAHLAGALGVPVWVALPFVPNWRWLLDRADNPWYPTMRLFRQNRPGDWAHVFDQLWITLKDVCSSAC